MKRGRIILLDNLDSFSYNLVDELSQLGFELEVYRNNKTAQFVFQRICDASHKEPVLLCLSPGPGHPAEAGCLSELISLCSGRVPMLGICLGFQALIEHSGGRVGRAYTVTHGKSSGLELSDHPVFANLDSPMQVARYHSLQAIETPAKIELLASFENVPMAIYNPANHSIGFQFHPESIMTTHGSTLLLNTVNFLLMQAETSLCRN